MPLPIESSPGAVSSLISRFQAASERDAEQARRAAASLSARTRTGTGLGAGGGGIVGEGVRRWSSSSGADVSAGSTPGSRRTSGYGYAGAAGHINYPSSTSANGSASPSPLSTPNRAQEARLLPVFTGSSSGRRSSGASLHPNRNAVTEQETVDDGTGKDRVRADVVEGDTVRAEMSKAGEDGTVVEEDSMEVLRTDFTVETKATGASEEGLRLSGTDELSPPAQTTSIKQGSSGTTVAAPSPKGNIDTLTEISPSASSTEPKSIPTTSFPNSTQAPSSDPTTTNVTSSPSVPTQTTIDHPSSSVPTLAPISAPALAPAPAPTSDSEPSPNQVSKPPSKELVRPVQQAESSDNNAPEVYPDVRQASLGNSTSSEGGADADVTQPAATEANQTDSSTPETTATSSVSRSLDMSAGDNESVSITEVTASPSVAVEAGQLKRSSIQTELPPSSGQEVHEMPSTRKNDPIGDSVKKVKAMASSPVKNVSRKPTATKEEGQDATEKSKKETTLASASASAQKGLSSSLSRRASTEKDIRPGAVLSTSNKKTEGIRTSPAGEKVRPTTTSMKERETKTKDVAKPIAPTTGKTPVVSRTSLPISISVSGSTSSTTQRTPLPALRAHHTGVPKSTKPPSSFPLGSTSTSTKGKPLSASTSSRLTSGRLYDPPPAPAALNPHHTGTAVIQRSSLYAPTKSSLAKAKVVEKADVGGTKEKQVVRPSTSAGSLGAGVMGIPAGLTAQRTGYTARPAVAKPVPKTTLLAQQQQQQQPPPHQSPTKPSCFAHAVEQSSGTAHAPASSALHTSEPISPEVDRQAERSAKPLANTPGAIQSGPEGRKIRCKQCRRELATRDHMTAHLLDQSRDPQPQMSLSTSSGQSESTPSTSQQPSIPGCTTSNASTESQPDVGPVGGQSAAIEMSPLAPDTNALPKSPDSRGGPASALPLGGQRSSPILTNLKCSGYFVEPLTWMDGFLNNGGSAGKVLCPNEKCKAKIGSYDWSGVQCGCGEWVTPGFCIHRSKVDEIL